MAETVFLIARPSNKKERRFVADTGFALGPGKSLDVPLSKVNAQLVSDVLAGEFTSTPALPRDAVDPDANINKLVEYLGKRNTKFALNADVVGGGGVIKLNGFVEVQDGDSIRNTLSDGLRVKVQRQSGTGKIDGAVLTEKLLTLQNGRADFTVEIPAPALTTTVIKLLDDDATGLNVTDTASFAFAV